jgi:hypothetical protein
MRHPTHSASDQEKFSILYSSYARAYERFLENGFKTLATVLVVLGWLLSSQPARAFFAVNDAARLTAVGLIAIGAVFLCMTFGRLSSLSRALRVRLDRLAFMECEFYDQHRVSPMIYWSVVGQILLLCLFAAGILLSPGLLDASCG